MMNKKSILVFALFAISHTLFCQENEVVLSTPEDWKVEIIPFPLEFAPTMDFVGMEDLRFSPGWRDSTSQEFWTYSFAWYIEKEAEMTESKLTESFNLYYDGLMGVDKKPQVDSADYQQLDKTICLFVKTDEGFTGKMRVYDMFFTKDYIILNIKVKESFCAKTNKQIILCDVSPKHFDHEVWGIFDEVKIQVKCE